MTLPKWYKLDTKIHASVQLEKLVIMSSTIYHPEEICMTQSQS